jgi:hypothetical protein
LLAQRPQRVSGKSAVEVVRAFLSIADHLKEGLTLRQLSSRCFWRDLDFSGFMILKSLCRVFGGVQAWSEGYICMLDLLNKAEGHFAKFGNKKAQMNSGTTGCPFSDQILLPALRSKGIFIAQEAIVE